jgi:hypothetical protein
MVIDWLFTKRFGFLPTVINEYTGRADTGSRKVTNLSKIADYYPQILEAMRKAFTLPKTSVTMVQVDLESTTGSETISPPGWSLRLPSW